MICVLKIRELEGHLKSKRCRKCDGSNIKCVHYYNQVHAQVYEPKEQEEAARPDWVAAAYQASDRSLNLNQGVSRPSNNGFCEVAESVAAKAWDVFNVTPPPAPAGEKGAPPRAGEGRKPT